MDTQQKGTTIMDETIIRCPVCGENITAIVNREIRRRQTEKARSKILKRQKSSERLTEWRKNNPQKARAIAINASHSRTPETYAKQAESIRATLLRKAVIFAQLIQAEKDKGNTITPQIEAQLLKKAATQAKKKK